MTPDAPVDPSTLRACSWLAALDSAALAEIAARGSRVSLHGGEVLFHEGDPADAMFVVLRGSLNIVIQQQSGAARVVDTLPSGSVLGELALLLNEPRSATVVARRDTELLRVEGSLFEQILASSPAAATELARLLGSRLKRTTRQTGARASSRAILLVPLDDEARSAAAHLEVALQQLTGSACLVSQVQTPIYHPDEWESRFKFVLLDGRCDDSEWTLRGLRQADTILLVAAGGDPGILQQPAARGLLAASAGTRLELLVLQRAAAAPLPPWLAAAPFARHHIVRAAASSGDFARVARSLAGRAIGLVLSGGGARGFAHIGVIDALRQRGVSIDVVGGSSMGAIIAAQHAMGFNTETMIAKTRQAFVDKQSMDLTLPVVSLTSATATVRKLKRLFGETNIEDLAVRYFCLSTNLSLAQSVVHDRGPLWLATRASCAIPGLAPPVSHGQHLLVDGGLLNNLPADVMRSHAEGAVIGVNVTPGVDLTITSPWPPHMSGWGHLRDRLTNAVSPHPSIVEILSRTALVSSMRDAARMAAHCDLYIEPDVERFGMTDFAAIDDLVAAGRAAAEAALPAWLERAGITATTHV